MVTNTYQLIGAVKKMYPVIQFFKDRYFPDGKNFHSDEVLIECKKKGRKIAPFVVPYVNGIAMESQKYSGYKFKPPYIAPKSGITVQDLRDKAFGEDPNSNRSAESRENELQAERMDDLRESVLRTFEKMCAEILTTGGCIMRHYAKPEDFGTDKYQEMKLQFYEDSFDNEFELEDDWHTMSVQEKIKVFYGMARILKKRGIGVTDVVLGADVSTDLFSDIEFLEYFNKKNVEFGTINMEEIPEGVTFNGQINVLGVMLNFFTYDAEYEDLKGECKEFIPSSTILMLEPAMGTTVYGPVDFVGTDGAVHSYAEKLVPRVRPDDDNNLITVHMYSRPVPYPLDFESWLFCDTSKSGGEFYGLFNDEDLDDEYLDDGDVQNEEPLFNGVSADQQKSVYKTVEEINSMTKKADVIAYAESIGKTGLTDSMNLAELKEAVIIYQDELQAAEDKE